MSHHETKTLPALPNMPFLCEHALTQNKLTQIQLTNIVFIAIVQFNPELNSYYSPQEEFNSRVDKAKAHCAEENNQTNSKKMK